MINVTYLFLQMTCEGLKRQVKEEIHSRTVLQARISSDSTELVKSKVEAKQKNEKVSSSKDREGMFICDVTCFSEGLKEIHWQNMLSNKGLL